MKLTDIYRKWIKERRWKRVLKDMGTIKKVIKSVDDAMKSRGWTRADRRRYWDEIIRMGD